MLATKLLADLKTARDSCSDPQTVKALTVIIDDITTDGITGAPVDPIATPPGPDGPQLHYEINRTFSLFGLLGFPGNTKITIELPPKGGA